MKKNSLELHLQTLCIENPEYTSLLSTWNLNKKTCIDALKTVVASYPHFSMHDVTHAEAVVTKIEMLLGDRVYKLSPTDTWLILHAAYAHDLGMVLKWEDIEKVWGGEKFSRFLEATKDSVDGQISKAAHVICSVRDGNISGTKVIDPLQMSRFVTLLNAAYFRKYHSEISRKYIDLWEDGLKIDLGHSGLIQPRLIKLLGKICELHTADSDEVLKLDYQTDGFGSDYAHPRLIAMLLRLGDLLDADNGRFSSTATLSIGNLPDSSVPHKNKHESTIHLLVTPTDIEFRSDCPDQESYLETRNFISWLESEIEFLKKYWDIITPCDFGGYVPRFDKKDVLINGTPDLDGVAGLKFIISQEKAFQIVEGSNIYCDPFICFREIVQNALDASKIQMWRDLVAGNYVAWMGNTPITNKIQPFDIHQSIFKNYAIHIAMSTLPSGKTQIEISDRGTGISVENFKRMCNVGISTSCGDANEELIASMPAWLRPTAGFGIGLQSIFLLTDQFEISTSTGTESYQAFIHSNRTGGYLQLRRMEKIIPRGTSIKMQFDMPTRYSYDMFGETMRYLYDKYDPFANENLVGEIRTIEAIRKNCSDSIFPIFISSSMEHYKDAVIAESIIAISAKAWTGTYKDYRYKLSEDCTKIDIWDTVNHAYGEVELTKRRYGHSSVCFKGIQVTKGVPHVNIDGLQVDVDVYGLETKKTLSLDRASLISPGDKKVKEILTSVVNLYIEKVIERLNSGAEQLEIICSSPQFDPYVFWLACDPMQRKDLPNGYIEYISENADVLIKGEDKKFKKGKKPVKAVIQNMIEHTLFANINKFEDPVGKRDEQYDNICRVLNESNVEDISEVVIDRRLLSAVNAYNWNSFRKPEANGRLILFSVAENNGNLKINDVLRSEFIFALDSPLEGINYENYTTSVGRRFAIPSINGYESLVVAGLPFGVARPSIKTNWIIAPFTSDYREKVGTKTKEEFTKAVMEASSFNSLVEYVTLRPIGNEERLEETVRDAYKKLIEEYYHVVKSKIS